MIRIENLNKPKDPPKDPFMASLDHKIDMPVRTPKEVSPKSLLGSHEEKPLQDNPASGRN
ncbi:MAG: hypothetical protein US75_C0026G0003 [Candidatus Woesebacteria bacterium GW2011_GWC1_38_13]|uniref:Uncharacterized protein n=3 Tax=Candidatus Woeseibacteriota TaxID=1752722 RepID=A0A0G0KU41_9BACT|nr:MAG: hypothetical protein US67_C0043G0011 [Candidatus Woesebacteria bacterium GW2011_GWD1_38_10]KKQ55287.1 MAG: hypothetical protein US75_C0026G0003 [Candidatus Woesebacteria bacterium GW2011_GWC1_38_13]KKQ83188.1 MAG: hypothetical protein UT06_C0026G0011 [Candidatus Woesebacteria bacterium GW2011_GWA1_38_8]